MMAAQPSIGGVLCESSVIPFLIPCRKVWLTPTAPVLCSNTANVEKHKIWTQSEFCSGQNSVRGQEPPKMYLQCTSQGDSETSCKGLLTSVERRWCSNEAKTPNFLKFAGVPQTRSQPLVGWRSQYCGNMWRRYCCLTCFFFPIVDTCLSCEDVARQSCAMVCRWQFFCDLHFQRAACSTFQTWF